MVNNEMSDKFIYIFIMFNNVLKVDGYLIYKKG